MSERLPDAVVQTADTRIVFVVMDGLGGLPDPATLADGVGAPPAAPPVADGDGSIMIVVATDAPLDARLLRRLALRALVGLGRTGSSMSNGSGDYVIAFSTAPGAAMFTGGMD